MIAVLACISFFIFWLWYEGPFVWFVATLCVIVAFVFIFLSALVVGSEEVRFHFSEFAQGLAGIVAIIALFIAAGLYFVERRDRVRIALSVEANVIALPASSGEQRAVLLTIRVPIENKGAQRVTLRCIALDVRGLAQSEALRRDPGSREDLKMSRITDLGTDGGIDQACVDGEARARGRPAAPPLFMWSHLILEPEETDDLHFEILVPCQYALVRALVKVRVNPADDLSYESKVVVPLADVCTGKRDIRSTTSAGTADAGAAPTADAAAPPD